MGFISKLLSGLGSSYSKQDQLNADACQQYCQTHSYTLMPRNFSPRSINIAGSASVIINAGYGLATNGFEGTVGESPFQVYLWAVEGSGNRSGLTDFLQVGAIELAHALPSVLIRPKVGPLSMDYLIFNNLKNVTKVQLEGDFNNYFEVFSSSSIPVNAFEVLPPDIMATLIDNYSAACIELSNNYLYLFLPVNGTTSGAVSLVVQPSFNSETQDDFLNKLVELRKLYESMNNTDSKVSDADIIKDKPVLTVNLNI